MLRSSSHRQFTSFLKQLLISKKNCLAPARVTAAALNSSFNNAELPGMSNSVIAHSGRGNANRITGEFANRARQRAIAINEFPNIANLLLELDLESDGLKPKQDDIFSDPADQKDVSPSLAEETTARKVFSDATNWKGVYPSPLAEETIAKVIELEDMLYLKVGLGSGRVNKRTGLPDICSDRALDKAEDIILDLKAEGFVFNAEMKAIMFDRYLSFGRLYEAEELYADLSKEVLFSIDDLDILRYVLCLASNEKIEEAFTALENHRSGKMQYRKDEPYQQKLAAKLLTIFADMGSVECVKNMFELLYKKMLIHLNDDILCPLIEVHIVRYDLECALVEFERCVNEYSLTPFKQELFCRCIDAEDADRLQRVLDLNAQVHGEVDSLYDLVFAFLECGKIEQARKIMETRGLEVRNEKLELACKTYFDEDRTSELENLIEITKEVYRVDRNSMYFYLLQAYCKAGDSEQALSILDSLQKENIKASSDLLIYLADFLCASGRPKNSGIIAGDSRLFGRRLVHNETDALEIIRKWKATGSDKPRYSEKKNDLHA